MRKLEIKGVKLRCISARTHKIGINYDAVCDRFKISCLNRCEKLVWNFNVIWIWKNVTLAFWHINLFYRWIWWRLNENLTQIHLQQSCEILIKRTFDRHRNWVKIPKHNFNIILRVLTQCENSLRNDWRINKSLNEWFPFGSCEFRGQR